jgi:predicted TIM-barrel fold metal-dependent hydrolase
MHLDYQLIDADSHYYEPDDCFTRHIEKQYADRVVRVVRGESPHARVYIGQDRLNFFSAPPGEVTGSPGSLYEFLRSGGEGGDHMIQNPLHGLDVPEFVNRDARLRWMDSHDVEASLLLPSLGVGVEHQLRHDSETTFANLRAFNRWIEDDWGFSYLNRIIGVPMLSLIDIDLCVGELERVLKAGARIVHLRPGPVNGRSPADPNFDPFWSRVQEAGIPVCFHLGDDGYTEYQSALWGEKPNPPCHRRTIFQNITSSIERAIVDTMCALITHNLFGRFPEVTVISIENGSDWVLPLIKKMNKFARMMDDRDWMFGKLKEKPGEIFKRHVRVAPFFEDDLPKLIAGVGVGNVLGGSDFPHPEGLADPRDFASHLEGQPYGLVRSVMRDNLRELLHL